MSRGVGWTWPALDGRWPQSTATEQARASCSHATGWRSETRGTPATFFHLRGGLNVLIWAKSTKVFSPMRGSGGGSRGYRSESPEPTLKVLSDLAKRS